MARVSGWNGSLKIWIEVGSGVEHREKRLVWSDLGRKPCKILLQRMWKYAMVSNIELWVLRIYIWTLILLASYWRKVRKSRKKIDSRLASKVGGGTTFTKERWYLLRSSEITRYNNCVFIWQFTDAIGTVLQFFNRAVFRHITPHGRWCLHQPGQSDIYKHHKRKHCTLQNLPKVLNNRAIWDL